MKVISLDARRKQSRETRVDQLCAAVESDFVEGPILDARNVDGSIGIKIGALEVWETPDEARAFAERILKAVRTAREEKEEDGI